MTDFKLPRQHAHSMRSHSPEDYEVSREEYKQMIYEIRNRVLAMELQAQSNVINDNDDDDDIPELLDY